MSGPTQSNNLRHLVADHTGCSVQAPAHVHLQRRASRAACVARTQRGVTATTVAQLLPRVGACVNLTSTTDATSLALRNSWVQSILIEMHSAHGASDATGTNAAAVDTNAVNQATAGTVAQLRRTRCANTSCVASVAWGDMWVLQFLTEMHFAHCNGRRKGCSPSARPTMGEARPVRGRVPEVRPAEQNADRGCGRCRRDQRKLRKRNGVAFTRGDRKPGPPTCHSHRNTCSSQPSASQAAASLPSPLCRRRSSASPTRCAAILLCTPPDAP